MDTNNPAADLQDQLYTSFMQTEKNRITTHPERVFNALGMTSTDVGMWFIDAVRDDIQEAIDDLTIQYVNKLVDEELGL